MPINQVHNGEELNVKPRLRVLQVFGILGVGGAETWLLSLLKYFNDAAETLPFSVETSICLTNGERGELDDEAVRLGAKLHYIRYGRGELIEFARSFRNLLAAGNFHAIHDHQDLSAGIHFLIGLGRLPPMKVAHVHNPPYRFASERPVTSRLARSAGRQILRLANATIAGTSLQLLKDYRFNTDGETARPIYCGFDVSAFRADREEARARLRKEFAWPSDAQVVLFVGRLGGEEILQGGVNHKNPDFALEIYQEALLRRPQLRMLFVGEKGQMHPLLNELVMARAQTESVRFLGLRRDIPDLMLGSDALLFPSSAEGLGMVAVEAQAAGLPVLASDRVPAECVVVPSLVRFMPLELDAATWAAELLDILASPKPPLETCNEMVEQSEFSIATSASQLLELYSRGIRAR